LEEGKLKNGRPYGIEDCWKNGRRTGMCRLSFEANDDSSIEWPVYLRKRKALELVKFLDRISAPLSDMLKLHIMARERHG